MPPLPAAPGSTFQVNQDNLLCLPARWTTVARFFVFNYAAHAVTIWSRPGEATAEKIFAMVLTFFFPVAGLGRGIDAVHRHALYNSAGGMLKGLLGSGSNEYEIQKAARAGALGIVVREQIGESESRKDAPRSCFSLNKSNWDGATLRGSLYVDDKPHENVLPRQAFHIDVDGDRDAIKTDDLRSSRNINGLASQNLQSGYRIIELPIKLAKKIEFPDEKDSSARTKGVSKLHISQSSSLLATFIAVCQIIYAAYELSRVTGDQLERFGYSAFSLTVIPYLAMSFINLVGNLATPVYPSMYIVNTSTLEEAQERGYEFQGAIGYIDDVHLQGEREPRPEIGQMRDYHVISRSCEEPSSRLPRCSRDPPCEDCMVLEICFEKKCHGSEKYQLRVPYGAPPVDHTNHGGELLFKSVTLILALAVHIAPIVYVGLNYDAPSKMDEKIVFPLWIAIGDAFGLYLLYNRISLSIVLHLWLWIRQKLFCGWSLNSKQKKAKISSKPFVCLICFFAGIAVAVWNFYIVAIQILAFGDCMNVSTRG